MYEEQSAATAAHQRQDRVIQDDLKEQHVQILQRTYLYLRSSMVVVVAAIFLAIAFTPDGYKPDRNGVLESISHYYYSPARIVFTGALWAAALALLVISGNGPQTYLLDLAAILAPLIAIVPTRAAMGQLGGEADLGTCVAGWQEQWPDQGCIPEDQLGYVAVGFNVWLCLAGVGLLFTLLQGIYRRVRTKSRVSPWYWIVYALGVLTVGFYALLWWSPWSEIDHGAMQVWGHFVAAAAFFFIIMVVAVLEAWRQWAGEQKSVPFRFSRSTYAWIYAVTATVLAVDIAAAIVIVYLEPPGAWVFAVETVALITFACFWAVQTFEHCKDADGWEAPPPFSVVRLKRAPGEKSGAASDQEDQMGASHGR